MMWTTWRSPGASRGAIESATAIGPSNVNVVLDRRAPRAARGGAPRQRLAAVDPAARQQPVLLARLLLAAEQHAVLPAQERRDADARLHQCRDDPKPRTPRSDSGSSSTSTSSTSGSGEDHELGDPHPRLDDERLARVGVEQVDLQLAAVAGVDEARRVDDRDAVLRGEARARLDEAGVPLRDRDGEAGPDERALAGRELDALARGEVEARRRPRTRAPAGPRRRAAAGSGARSGALPVARTRLGDEIRREARAGRGAAGARRRARPPAVSSRSSIGAPSA